MVFRRTFMRGVCTSALALSWQRAMPSWAAPGKIAVANVRAGEDVFGYIERVAGQFDLTLLKGLLGAANEFKEGDEIVGVAAADDATRANARQLLLNTRVCDLDDQPVLRDQLYQFIMAARNKESLGQRANWTLQQWKDFLLSATEAEIHKTKSGLSSDVIGCLVKLMTNAELISVGAKIFNPLPNSQIGAKGYLGARIQPNSPTDNLDDIQWQVFSGFAYAVGDVLLGTNPVSSEIKSVAAVEGALNDILQTFDIQEFLPHCVLSHIDVQAAVEHQFPNSTALWFQSIAGNDKANATFDITIEKMSAYARARRGLFGLYFETGQGADFTNGHDHGFDMVLHESRKYGLARGLSQLVAEARGGGRESNGAWVHVNDVAGFIGPEVFRTRDQLVRCCLEDIVMGKLHGLTIGLDVCSTLHMDVSLEDLDWCLDRIAPANPAYLMALPTKIDPMLGYLTTGFQDHLRLRQRYAYKVNDRMWDFFQRLQIVDGTGQPTEHFGDPLWVYLQYRRRKLDSRSDDEIQAEGRQKLAEIRERGVFIAQGYGQSVVDLEPTLSADIRKIYSDAKKCIWVQWEDAFVENLSPRIVIDTQSKDRLDYILHPNTGERLSSAAIQQLNDLRTRQAGKYNVQIVVSDGLNALALMDEGNLQPLLAGIQSQLQMRGLRSSPELVIVRSGRVRAGYRIGQLLFGGLGVRSSILHVIGERPGSGHHTMSVYLTTADSSQWASEDQVDHNITKVVSGIATTALQPAQAALDVVRLLVQT